MSVSEPGPGSLTTPLRRHYASRGVHLITGMAKGSPSRPIPEHWSKDYVEHLRTVHFTLLTVSAGLLLVLLSKSYDAQLAASQLADVMRISKSSETDITPLEVYKASPDDGVEVGINGFYATSDDNTVSVLVKDLSYTCDSTRISYRRIALPWADNMGDFRYFWDKLRTAPIPIDVIEKVRVVLVDGTPPKSTKLNIKPYFKTKADDSVELFSLKACEATPHLPIQ